MTQEVMIQIFESDFNNDGLIQTVNARDLHEALGIQKDFTNWIKCNLQDFKENQDFIIFAPKGEKSRGRPRTDYAITLDTAKHICMMARCEKGRQLRQYFIEVEKQYRLGYTAPAAAQIELIPGTPEHFTECFTQAYRSYFGEPVLQTALADQQQHTEPVQAQIEYHEQPEDKLSWKELSEFIAHKDLVMKCFEICGVHSEQFDPGYSVKDGVFIHCRKYPVYDKRQALAVILAIYELSTAAKREGFKTIEGGPDFKDKLGNRCFTDIPQAAVDSAKRMIQAYIIKHGKLI